MDYRCSICKQNLIKIDHSYKCNKNHNFDIAKEGYVNLLRTNKKNHGDDDLLVNARINFHKTDSYHKLKETLNHIIKQYKHNSLLDLACGEGYYTSSFDYIEEVIGVDISKKAIRHASKIDKHASYIIASIFDLPLYDDSFDIITTIFAPIANKEIERLLKTNGIFIEVTPGTNHLLELKQVLYPNVILNKPKLQNFNKLKHIDTIKVDDVIHLDNEAIINLFYMTPYVYKTSIEATNKLKETKHLDITISFNINIYQKTLVE